MQQDIYATKEQSYFRNVRREILPFLSPRGCSILEVGCGEGATLRYLKEQGGAAWVGGIEIHAPAASLASQHLDWMSNSDIESRDTVRPDRQADILLLLDVLEHLRDPWNVLAKLARELLKPGGTVIVTLPNIRNLRVVGKLLALGDWKYTDVGILDRTHLRFFTRRTGLDLIRQADLEEASAVPLIPRSLQWSERALRITHTDEFVASQILFKARRPA
jgi:2-polyprenyl-3-methyl-5-hydroxy-6-metoxy-1,4-benzoquinol methylase